MSHESMAARRIIRASRMLAEQGHDGDALGALYEMVELRKQRDELLAALDGLLNALPSATSHPAIKAAKAARANAMKDEK